MREEDEGILRRPEQGIKQEGASQAVGVGAKDSTDEQEGVHDLIIPILRSECRSCWTIREAFGGDRWNGARRRTNGTSSQRAQRSPAVGNR